MNKKTKRILSLLLCVVMVCSLCTAAFAEAPAKQYRHFDSIFVFGDSNSMGYGLPGYKGNPLAVSDPDFDSSLDGTDHTYLHGVPGSFGYETAIALGLTDESSRDFMVHPALRAKDALHFLGAGVDDKDEAFERTYEKTLWNALIETDAAKEDGQYFYNRIKAKEGDQKLILVYFGAAEIFHNALWQVFAIHDDENPITKIPEILLNDYINFVKYYPQLIEFIKEANPGAQIVMVGTFNPTKDVKLTESSLVAEFNAIGVISDLMNAQYKKWAEEYDAIYVDVSDVETYSQTKATTLSDIDMTFGHATPAGYKYMSRQILKALEVEQSTHDIVLDLGSVNSVSSVTVDGYIVRDYSFDADSHTLTVPYGSAAAKNITVTENRGSAVYLVSYRLTWNGNGYDAYRLYSTRDLSGSLSVFISPLKSFFKTVFDTFFGFLR